MDFNEEHIVPFTEFEKKGWEQAADAYHYHWGSLSSQSAEAMLKATKVRIGSRVLDVASGAGYVAVKAAEIGATSLGLDFSQAQV
ncbi:MAG: methyltransferase type 11, partial [Pseudomonadota bacterium]